MVNKKKSAKRAGDKTSLSVESSPEVSSTEDDQLLPSTPSEQAALSGILSLLLKTTRIDFSHYRQPTVLRRMARRLSLSNKKNLAEYLAYLESNPDEAERLFDDLLLSHTEFFRDKAVFDTLKQDVFPRLTEGRSSKMPVRIWVAGCSSGEEVYSFAMTLNEFLAENKSCTTAQIFGTDLNMRHIKAARRAVYSDKIRKTVSPERLARFFDETPEGLRVCKQIREMCVFAVQDITQDPPFPAIDLVSCRNVLIYFDSSLQEIVIPLFHFALKPDGYLLLGSSESMGKFTDLFNTVNQQINLYAKRAGNRKIEYRFPSGQFASRFQPAPLSPPVVADTHGSCCGADINSRIDAVLLQNFVPPCLVVDSTMQIRQFRGDTSPYLTPAPGEASLKLSKMTREGLMPDIYIAIEEVKKKNEKVVKRNITFRQHELVTQVDLSVFPVIDPSTGETCFLITFKKPAELRPPEKGDRPKHDDAKGEQARLKDELSSIKEHLQSLVDEKDMVNQELWAANEEIQSTNEELQSVNEEMAAAKEELEASNEELRTLNEEMQVKNADLKAEKDFTERLVDTAQTIILILDSEGRIVRFNRYLEELTGFSLSEVAGKEWVSVFIPPENRAAIRSLFGRAISDIPTKANINPILTKDGRTIETEWFDKTIKDDNGRITGLLAIGQDITERKRVEEALRKSEARLLAILDATPFPIAIVDMEDDKIDFWSRSAEVLFGHTAPTVAAWYKLAYPDPVYRLEVIDRWKPFLEKARASGGTVNTGEYRVTCSDGSVRICELYAAFIIENLVVTFNDITERKKAEAELVRSDALMRTALENLPLIFYMINHEGKFTLSIGAGLKGLGLEQNQVVGMSVFDVYKDYSEITAAVHKALAGETVAFETEVRGSSYFNICVPFFPPDDQSRGIVAVALDITERRRTEDALRNMQKLESLGVLAGGIAHDFNNLMGGIFGYIDLAKEERDHGTVSTYLSKAMATIDRARGLTHQLLTFAKGGAPVKRPGRLFPFVQETAAFALSGSNVSCTFDIPADLRSCDFDRNQIGQVVDNIIINAQQAMPAGGVIELAARNVSLGEKEHPRLAGGEYVELSIRDHGIGIPKELLPRIFDPFFTTKSKGHGLGLATSYSIVNRHGGAIEVESEPGKGSVFHILLPAAAEPVSDMSAAQVVRHKGSGTIIVMDDEGVVRDAIGGMLKTLGYSVVKKNNGREALDFFIQTNTAGQVIKALVFDLTVPGGMGGKEAAMEIRKINREVPVFVASGYADDPVMKDPGEYGFTASICKPFRMAELAEMLEKYLKNS